MPVETTENYVRVRVRNPGTFQEGSFRTIDISKDEGIRAVIGKLEGETSTTVQSYLFDKEEWTESEASDWVAEHKKEKMITRGIYLVEPHGHLTASGKKRAIAKADELELEGKHVLVSKDKAYGIIDLSTAQSVTVEEFDERFDEHRVTTKERKKWWDGKDELYLYEIKDFEEFDPPKEVEVPENVKFIIREVQFKDDGADEELEMTEKVMLGAQSLEMLMEDIRMAFQASDVAERLYESGDGPSYSPWIAATYPNLGYLICEWKNEFYKVNFIKQDDEYQFASFNEWTPVEKVEEWILKLKEYETEMKMYEDEMLVGMKFAGSPKNAFGTHSSYQFKGDYAKAWRIHFSQVGGGALTGNASGPVRGTVRRTEMIAAAMEPKCDLPSTESIGARGGGDSPLPGKFSKSPSDYGRSSWKEPEDEADREGMKLSCADLKVIKRAALAEIKWRAEQREKSLSEKAGRRIRRDKVDVLKELKGKFSELMDMLKDLVGFAEYDDKKPKEWFEKAQGVKALKLKDGRTGLLTWTTNAFKDREDEIFTTKSIEDLVERNFENETKGTYDFWHIPGSDFADIIWQGVSGRFLAEIGIFTDTPVGQAFKGVFTEFPDGHPEVAPEGWGCSHGFKYKSEDRADGVYEWFEKEKSTVLPASAAANPHNPKLEVLQMDEKQKTALSKLVPDDVVELIETTGETETKRLENEKVEFKEKKEVEAAVEKKVEEPKSEEEVKDKGEKDSEPQYLTFEDVKEGFEGFAEVLKGIVADVSEMKASLKTLTETDEAKIKERVELTPKESLKAIAESAIGTKETLVDGRTKLASDGPEEAEPISESLTGIGLIDNIKARNAEKGHGLSFLKPSE